MSTTQKGEGPLNHLVGKIIGEAKGPTVIFFGGIHGNEAGGVVALEEVLRTLKKETRGLTGSFFAIRGNVAALRRQLRYVDEYLNRLWTTERIDEIKKKKKKFLNLEENQLLKLLELINAIIKKQSPPYYFFDLHTTSSPTKPFITINDALINRKFALQYPAPVILGIEEYLKGPLLSYMNERGFVSLGFESGQHDEASSIQHFVAFIWLSLSFTGLLGSRGIDVQSYFTALRKATKEDNSFYEITFRYNLEPQDQFQMNTGFSSFDFVEKGSLLGWCNCKTILAPGRRQLFMPLYQKAGNEAFFFIQKIPKFVMKLSGLIRSAVVDKIVVLFPGVSWAGNSKDGLSVGPLAMKIYGKNFFHLLGYRRHSRKGNALVLYHRERRSNKKMYRRTPWYSKNRIKI